MISLSNLVDKILYGVLNETKKDVKNINEREIPISFFIIVNERSILRRQRKWLLASPFLDISRRFRIVVVNILSDGLPFL